MGRLESASQIRVQIIKKYGLGTTVVRCNICTRKAWNCAFTNGMFQIQFLVRGQ